MEKLNTEFVPADAPKKRHRFIREALNKHVIGESQTKTLSLEEIREIQGNPERKRKPILSHKDQSRVKK